MPTIFAGMDWASPPAPTGGSGFLRCRPIGIIALVFKRIIGLELNKKALQPINMSKIFLCPPISLVVAATFREGWVSVGTPSAK